jgi:hypothetical protein
MTFEDALRAQDVYENVFTRGSQTGVTGLVVLRLQDRRRHGFRCAGAKRGSRGTVSPSSAVRRRIHEDPARRLVMPVNNACCGNELLASHSVHCKRGRCGIRRIVPGAVEAHSRVASSRANAAVVTLVGNRHVGATLGYIAIP